MGQPYIPIHGATAGVKNGEKSTFLRKTKTKPLPAWIFWAAWILSQPEVLSGRR